MAKEQEWDFEILKYSAGEKENTIDAVISSTRLDSDRHVIGDFDFEKFETHPVMLANHTNSIQNQIGRWSGFRKKGRELHATAEYFVDGELPHNIMAQIAFDLASRGSAAFSIRAIAKDRVVIWGKERIQNAPDVPTWAKKEKPDVFIPVAVLREVSQVALPANLDALQRAEDFDIEDWLLRQELNKFIARMGRR